MLNHRVSSRMPPLDPASAADTAAQVGAPVSASAKPCTRPAGIASLANRQSATPTAGRRAAVLPTRTTGMTPIAVQRLPGLSERLGKMKSYLTELRTAHAQRRELGTSRDTEFLDLLVATENARNPELNLYAHRVDYGKLLAGEHKAVGDLASQSVAGMRSGCTWHAVVSMDWHECALAVKHDPEHPHHLSVVVVDSSRTSFTSEEWMQLATALGAHLNAARGQAGKPRNAKVRINCLATGTQHTGEGSAIFALTAARDMPWEPDILRLHEETLGQAALAPAPFACKVHTDNTLLSEKFFRHMTRELSMQALLAARPELEDRPVNRKRQTLRARQAAHLSKHRPPYGLPYVYSYSYERERIKMYERAIDHVETAAAPQLLSTRLNNMATYLGDLRRAQGQGANLPAPQDAEFIDLLVGTENMRDEHLRLRAHKVDIGQLEAGHADSVSDLWTSLAEGVRSGAGWHATLDLNGHFAALSAHHDPHNAAHVSLAVLDGAGSPISLRGWQTLAAQLGNRLRQVSPEPDPAGSVKVRLTHLDVSARQPAENSALFALRAVKDMKSDRGIAEIHRNALAETSSLPEDIVATARNGADLLDPAYGMPPDAESYYPTEEAALLAEQIEMYSIALSHLERSLASMCAAARTP